MGGSEGGKEDRAISVNNTCSHCLLYLQQGCPARSAEQWPAWSAHAVQLHSMP